MSRDKERLGLAGVVLEYLEEAILEVLREQNPTANISRKDIFLAGILPTLHLSSSAMHLLN